MAQTRTPLIKIFIAGYMQYDHASVEKKWQQRWEQERAFEVDDAPDLAKKKYVLDMFPYPSGAGLHVGHPEGYTATDIYCRYLRMNGYAVLHPMGWDAFGLPAENYAIKSGVHPKEITDSNINTFRRQIKSLGFSYDWPREVNTASPDYYRWTQWIFLQFYRAGLAYRKKAPVNWCEDCQTVLANEQVVDGKCERCHHDVIQKDLKQWFLKITGNRQHKEHVRDEESAQGAYPESLLANLNSLDWPEPIKTMQRNWIGRSEGINLEYEVEGLDEKIVCFTTRPDTNFGATFVTLAPDSDFTKKNMDAFPEKQKVQQYSGEASKKTERERIDQGRKKTGVFTGLYAFNRLNEKKMPVYVGDFVLASVGTGAVVGVPGHDIRDFEFARAMGLEIIRVVVGSDNDRTPITMPEQVQEDEGTMVNSGFLDGLDIHDATVKVMDHLEEKGWGRRVVNYRLRDWLISRQRYWGAPIPIIYCEECGEQPVPEEDLPVELPDDVDFRPTGESPLARSASFHKVKCPKCKKSARRESDTMDTFVDSSWYFLRYTDPDNAKEFASRRNIKTWLPVDTYVGGAEHAVLHLLYARFVCMALSDLGHLDFEEPFLKLRNQGLIIGPDGQKMSKSRGNVINPDEVVCQLGADTMRMYEMFMGPLEDAKPWSTDGIIGVRRFIERVWSSYELHVAGYKQPENQAAIERELHRLIKKAGEDIESFDFNTAVSQFMIFMNAVYKAGEISKEHFEAFLKVLNPFAPHVTNELWEMLGNTGLLEKEQWPAYDEALLVEDEVTYAVQVNGKVRATVLAAADALEQDILELAKKDKRVAAYLKEKEILRTVFVPGKLINFVVK